MDDGCVPVGKNFTRMNTHERVRLRVLSCLALSTRSANIPVHLSNDSLAFCIVRKRKTKMRPAYQ